MKKYILSETQIKKIIDEIINEQVDNVQIDANENIKYGKYEFELFKTKYGVIKAGIDGILGDKGILIPWEAVIKLLDKFKV